MTVPIIAATNREPGARARARVGLLGTMTALLALLLVTGGSAAGQDDGYTDTGDVWTSKLQFDAFWLDLLTARAEANVAQGAFKTAVDLAGLRSSLDRLADITAAHMVTIQAIEPDQCWADLRVPPWALLGRGMTSPRHS